MSRSALISLPQAPTAPAVARRIVDGVERLQPEVAINARLLVSELVANAVRHANSMVEVVIRLLPERVRVEVRDNSPEPPLQRSPEPEDESGRGLFLVDTLTHAWGVEAREDGKSVWFEVLLT